MEAIDRALLPDTAGTSAAGGLTLVEVTLRQLELVLGLLGIEVPERM